ncbi:MAG: helix-turn-helix domain-containing protein [Candidatus Aenigmatarchaeota archaeon]
MTCIEISEELLTIKDQIGRQKKTFRDEADLKRQLQHLGHKVEKIEKALSTGRGNLNAERIKEIVFILENKAMTASDVGRILKMSRNRANEYLRCMEKKGILKSGFSGKKKFYRAVKK